MPNTYCWHCKEKVSKVTLESFEISSNNCTVNKRNKKSGQTLFKKES